MFARLGDVVDDARVADVFAGTGTIGLEALSRGSRSVVFFERDRKALELLERNVEQLGVSGEVLCWRADVLRTSFRPKGVDDFLPYDLVFLDPPYPMVTQEKTASIFYKAIEKLARSSVTSAEAGLVLRTPENHVSRVSDDWRAVWALRISGMQIEFFAKSTRRNDKSETIQNS